MIIMRDASRPGRAVLWAMMLAAHTLPVLSPAASGEHVHGRGVLSVALEDKRVDILLTVPLADLPMAPGTTSSAAQAVLFSHKPMRFAGAVCAPPTSSTSAAQNLAAADFFAEPAGVSTTTPPSADVAAGDQDEVHGDQHGEHGDPVEDAEHDSHDSHESDHAHEDIAWSWHYECDASPTSLTIEVFEHINIERIDTNVIDATGAYSLTLTAMNPEIEFRRP